MANTSSGGTQTCDKPANTNLSTEIRNYLLKVKNIKNSKTLNLLKRAKQTMKAVKTCVVTKNKNANASQMMNKMTKTMQKISQKWIIWKKKFKHDEKKFCWNGSQFQCCICVYITQNEWIETDAERQNDDDSHK